MSDSSPSNASPVDETSVAVETAQVSTRGGILGYAERHPMIVAWIVLAIGMVAILLYTSKDVGLLPTPTLAMVLATIALAGACVWIITWD